MDDTGIFMDIPSGNRSQKHYGQIQHFSLGNLTELSTGPRSMATVTRGQFIQDFECHKEEIPHCSVGLPSHPTQLYLPEPLKMNPSFSYCNKIELYYSQDSINTPKG